jgi:hypothetical protein
MNKNVVFIVNLHEKEKPNRNQPYHYCVKSWKIWCKKNNCELFVLEDRIYSEDFMNANWHKIFAFQLLESSGIDYNQILIADADTIIHPNAPNVFEMTDNKFCAVHGFGSYDWQCRSIENYKKHMFPDVDLDLFRELPWNNTFNSPRWYFHITGEQEDLSLPYMFVDKHPTINDRIVIQRTFRFRNIYINYEFIKNYESALFVGIKEEYDDLKKQIPNLEFYEPKDFLEIAQIIKSSKFFIGNQSVCYPIAEALKVPRLLEASPEFPVVQPVGKDAFDFYFQPHFEKWFDYLYNKN